MPFLYSRVGNRKSAPGKAPPPVLDLAGTDRDVWNKIFWTALQSLLLDPYGIPLKASTRSYRQNSSDYRKSHIMRALSVLSLYEAVAGPEGLQTFSDVELAEIQARLKLTDKTFGGLIGELNLQRYNEQQITGLRDTRGHNWELLRQRAEAESLFFEPLQMPDGTTTHALLWVAKSDLLANQINDMMAALNISNPWTDKRLLTGRAIARTLRGFRTDLFPKRRPARDSRTGPLALYGLDSPKSRLFWSIFVTPSILRRELSGRVFAGRYP